MSRRWSFWCINYYQFIVILLFFPISWSNWYHFFRRCYRLLFNDLIIFWLVLLNYKCFRFKNIVFCIFLFFIILLLGRERIHKPFSSPTFRGLWTIILNIHFPEICYWFLLSKWFILLHLMFFLIFLGWKLETLMFITISLIRFIGKTIISYFIVSNFHHICSLSRR